MVLRPDEEANLSEIERDENIRSTLKKGASTALGLAAGTTGLGVIGGGIASKIMPFLNQYIPTDLAMKGISKISPKLGDLLKKGQSMGLDLQEGLNFIKDKISGGEETAKENRNIIEQYDPELHIYLTENLKKGIPLIEAGKKALGHGRFKKSIEKMTKDHRSPWSAILQTVYGSMGVGKSQPEQQPQQPQQPITQNPPQQQQQGQGQAALMAILQKIQQSRGA